ncbi:OLC1v1001845C1 [Oldenlandia corymbosa var. corymbosa]|uniref:OLC1v1001845C1 n=1 Tax=Oldenlandia corymbosa var. corymbosa TaxID=529605 RepID=A0AAV1D694_OLDCO|nr:OLC1v1001845C1 [Oldenlandia corymbosa var. corymbosa]
MAGSKKGKSNNKKKGEKPKPKESNSKLSSHQESSSTLESVNPSDIDEETNNLFYEVYNNIELAYPAACEILLTLGYSSYSATLAMLCGGNIAGEKGGNMVANILKNSISFIENYPVVNGQHAVDVLPCFQTMPDLIQCWVQTLVNQAAGLYPEATQRELLLHVLGCKFVDVEGIVKDVGNSKNGDDDETDFDAFLKENINALRSVNLTWKPHQGMTNNNLLGSQPPRGSNDKGKNVMSGKNSDGKTEELAIKLEMKVKELEEQVKERKKGRESLEELLMRQKIEIANAHINSMLKMVLGSRKVNDALDIMEGRTSELRVQNLRLRAELSACRVNGAESERKLKIAMKKDKATIKQIEALEGMTDTVNNEIRETIQMSLQLDRQLHVTKEASNELEVRVRQALKQKEEANDLLKAEKRSLRIAKEAREEMLATLQQEIGAERKQVEHEWKTLYSESIILEQAFGFQDEPSSSSSSSSHDQLKTFIDNIWDNDCDIPIHRRCIMCLNRVAGVLFIPCGHQVICIQCRERIVDECPCCKEHIQEKVRVFGAP